MTPEFKAKFIEALRSGKYEQDAGQFKQLRTMRPDGSSCYCVMGVAADIIDPNAWDTSANAYISKDGFARAIPFGTDDDQHFGVFAALSLADLKAIGMTDAEQWDNFIGPNDRGDLTFADFADHLEATD